MGADTTKNKMMDYGKLHPELEYYYGASESLVNVLKDNEPGIPQDYLEFLRFSNGAVGFIGKSYIKIWSIDEVVDLNEAYEIYSNHPGLLYIGTNGGGEAYAIDLRPESKARYGMIPFITIGFNDLLPYGNSFMEFLDSVRDQFQKN